MTLLDNESWQKVISGDISLGLRVSKGLEKRISGCCYYPRFDSDGISVVSFDRVEDRYEVNLRTKLTPLEDEYGQFYVDVPSQTTIVANTIEQFDVGLNLIGITFGRMYDKFTGWSTGTELIAPGYGEGPIRLVTTNNAPVSRPFYLNSFLPKPADTHFGPAIKVLFFIGDEDTEAIAEPVGNGKAREMEEEIAKLRAEIKRVAEISWHVRSVRRKITFGAIVVAAITGLLWYYGLIGEVLMASMLSAVFAGWATPILTQSIQHAEKR